MPISSAFAVSCLGVLIALTALPAVESPVWEQAHAKRDPGGLLSWAPHPFVFTAGASVRYIDFANGDDAADGSSQQTAWRHHPWDTSASGQAAACTGIHTYVFKRGVTYRGALTAKDSGTATNPIRLTSDPQWGSGVASIVGSRLVDSDWQHVDPAQAPADLPDAARVWVADVKKFEAITSLWIGGAEPTRIALARHPNWTLSNHDDVLVEWAVCEDDEPAKAQKTVLPQVQMGEDRTWLIDSKLLTATSASAYAGATIWLEYAGLMGSPFPMPADTFDPKRHAIQVGSPWMSNQRPMTGSRYYLENHPRFLDQGGEYWHDTKHGKLYLRLPGDADPNTVAIEAAQLVTLIAIPNHRHIQISGLDFRHQRVPQIFHRFWDVIAEDPACVKITGASEGVTIANNSFRDVVRAVWAEPSAASQVIDHLVIADNDIRFCDYDAILVTDGDRKLDPKPEVIHVDVLRNRIRDIGARPRRADHGHAVRLTFVQLQTIAGNILERTYGSGIFLHGGKSGGDFDAPLARILVFQNQVSYSNMASNDWGGIETWQGGPAYVFDNVSIAPGGHWKYLDVITDATWKTLNQAWDKRYPHKDYPFMTQIRSVAGCWSRSGRNAHSSGFAFAYYCDGAFKQYYFNNIAVGRSSDLASAQLSTGAFQSVGGSFMLNIFNNTFYRFGVGIKRGGTYSAPDLFLGNIFEDMGDMFLAHEGPRDDPKDEPALAAADDPAAAARQVKSSILLQAWANNVFSGNPKGFGVIDTNGRIRNDLAGFAEGAEERHAMRSDTGSIISGKALANPAQNDFRPAAGSGADKAKVLTSVPWALSATVGEWQFRQLPLDPERIVGEHWYMTAEYGDRGTYRQLPRHDLHATGVASESYVAGPSEDWTLSALRFDGVAQSARILDSDLRADVVWEEGGGKNLKEKRFPGNRRITMDMQDNDFLIEAILRSNDRTGGGLAGKEGANGYLVAITADGKPELRIAVAGSIAYTARADVIIADDAWHHVLVELDRSTGAAQWYVDGKTVTTATTGAIPKHASLSNAGDFVVGADAAGNHLAMTIDFLRIARSTLAGSLTTIDELYAWQNAGPNRRTWTGAAVIE